MSYIFNHFFPIIFSLVVVLFLKVTFLGISLYIVFIMTRVQYIEYDLYSIGEMHHN